MTSLLLYIGEGQTIMELIVKKKDEGLILPCFSTYWLAIELRQYIESPVTDK